MVETAAQRVDPSKLGDYVSAIFVGMGLPDDGARIVAESLVAADLRGVRSHGVMRVSAYEKQILSGAVNPRPNLAIVSDNGGSAVVDGDGGMGQIGAEFAMRMAINRAGSAGIAAVGLRNSRHCGAMAHWAMMALPRDMIGFAATNAGLNMAPWGGVDRLVGNNPFAIAVPTNRDWPMVFDMATSVAAGGKLDMAVIRGDKIPIGWAIDDRGNPIDDPVIARSRGTLLPVGGPKGYGMAIMLDVLCGVLTGGRFGGNLGPAGSGQFFQAIDVSSYMPVAQLKERMDALIDQIHGSALAPGFDAIYVPGEIEHIKESDGRESGLPMETAILESLASIATKYGVPVQTL